MPAVAAIEPLGIGRVQSMHRLRKHSRRCLEDEVVVRIHEAPGVAGPLRRASGRFEHGEKLEPVDIVDEQRLAVHATCGHVVDAFGG